MGSVIFNKQDISNSTLFSGKILIVLHHNSSLVIQSPQMECVVCLKSFKYVDLHMNTHKLDKEKIKYMCSTNKCESKFTTISGRNDHIKRVHNRIKRVRMAPTKYLQSCLLCSKQVKNMGMHLKTHEQNSFNCLICTKKFSSKSGYFGHIRSAHKGKIRNKPKQKTFFCSMCDKTFTSAEHALTHTKEKPHKCEVCLTSFSLLSNMKRHTKSHSMEYKRYQCSNCLKKFMYIDKLQRHKRTVHIDMLTIPCSMCNKKFKPNGALSLHQKRMHFGEEKLNCKECGKDFKTRKEVKLHILLHSNERPYKCSKCVQTFKTTLAVKNHDQRMHVGLKKNLCDMCDGKFQTSSELKSHRAVHNTLRPYQCHTCNKLFRCKETEKRHTKNTHTP